MEERFTEDQVAERLSRYHDDKYTFEYASGRAAFRSLKLAAVLVPLFVRKGQVHVLLTVRSARMRRNPGDVAFPGGMRDATHDADETRTALREAHEEVALPPDGVRVVAKLLPRVTGTRVLMVPIVGIIPENFIPIPNEEVQDTFSLPLSRFLSDERHLASDYKSRGMTNWVHFFHDEGKDGATYTTWGLTAGVCIDLAVALFGRKPEFESPGTPEDPFGHQRRYLGKFEGKSAL